MQEGLENLGTPPEGTQEPPVESAPEPEQVPLTDRETLEAALEVAQQNTNQFDRTEAKVDALAKFVLGQK